MRAYRAVLLGSVLSAALALPALCDPPTKTDTPSSASPTPAFDGEAALKKASVDGKYRMLLRQFKAEGDRKDHGEFLRDFYTAQRQHLEHRLLLGDRRERKGGKAARGTKGAEERGATRREQPPAPPAG